MSTAIAAKFLLPLSLLVIGIGIHAFALFGVEVGDTPTWVHALMLGVDSFVFLSLSLRPRVGRWLAIALFTQQSIFQSYWTFRSLGNGWSLWPLQVVATIACIAALVVLLRAKR